MRIEDIDPSDDAALEAFWAHEARLAAGDPYDVVWTREERKVRARLSDPWTERQYVWARDDDGAIVATAELNLSLRDNLEVLWADLRIDPARRAEVGPFLEDLKDRTRLSGRTRIAAEARWASGGPEGPDAELLRAHGFRLGNVEAQRVLDLPADEEHLERLATRTAPHHASYALRSWVGPVPEDVVDAYGAMRSVMGAEAPSGEMEWEAEDFPADRVRHEEEELAAQQRTSVTTVAVHEDGTIAGHSQIVVPGTDPVNAMQWDTLVLSAHRGHRLGLAMKVQNLRTAARALGQRSLLHTWNAADNAPMIAVNETLGYRLVAIAGVFRCDV